MDEDADIGADGRDVGRGAGPARRRRRARRRGGRDGIDDDVGGNQDGREVNRLIQPYEYILADIRENGMLNDWYFENVDGFEMLPGDDWESTINQKAKIVLDPRYVYRVSQRVHITSLCYVVGNGAKVIVDVAEGPAFVVTGNRLLMPVIGFMERVCFSSVMFVRENASNQAVVILSDTNILVHNCVFMGPHSLCLRLRCGGTVRGCHFMAAVCGIHSGQLVRVIVKSCVFEKCFFGVLAEGKITVSKCCFTDCLNSFTLDDEGLIVNNTISISNRTDPPFGVRLCTCKGGSHVVPLGNIHIRGGQVPWPRFENNTLVRVRMYLGKRCGVLHMKQCMLAMSVICSFRAIAQRISLDGSYESSASILQTVKLDARDAEERLCTCGDRHLTPLMHNVNVSADVKPDRELSSVDTAEFSSSDDD